MKEQQNTSVATLAGALEPIKDQPTWDYDDYDVRMFPDEATTRAKRVAANFFLEHHLFMPIWRDVALKEEWDKKVFVPEYTAEWLKQQFDEHLAFLNEEAAVLPPDDPFQRDPRFTLPHLYGEAQRQWAKSLHRRTEFDPNTHWGRSNIEALEYHARVYSTIQGLIEQAIQLDAPPGMAPSLPGPAPLLGK